MTETETASKTESEATSGEYRTVGRRKSAVARVRLRPGKGDFRINRKKSLDEYFGREQDRLLCMAPLRLTNCAQKFDVHVTVAGGGSAGQAGAIRMGISRALVKADPSHHGPLKAVGFLTRDPRQVERKKPGKAGARRSYQFSKR